LRQNVPPLRTALLQFTEIKNKQAELAAEKVGRFVGRGFSHDVSALDSSGVLTPEARKCHFSSACEAFYL
jgi:hypothetical protein